MLVKPLHGYKPRLALVIHTNITSQMIAVMEASKKRQDLNLALGQLQAMANQIKDAIATEQRTGFSKLLPSQPGPSANQKPMAEAERLNLLSKREMEILVGIVRGERNADIASRLTLSAKSISTYRSRVLKKLGVESNAQLVALATQTGLLQSN
jgi:DNA-binding NarL/FixJ family response regulator